MYSGEIDSDSEGNYILSAVKSTEKNGIEDLKKALWYLNYLVEVEE